MSAKWCIHANTIAVSDNASGISTLTASDIYSIVFGGDIPAIAANLEPLQESFPTVRFSRIPVATQLIISVNSGRITYRIEAQRRGVTYTVNTPTAGGSDHYLDGNSWFYFDGSYHLIVDALRSVDAECSDIISFKQYVHLINYSRIHPEVNVIDEAHHVLKDSSVEAADIPVGIEATLYPYQSTGFNWLKHITGDNCGCILGDEMGLGKTLQVITLFQSRLSQKQAPYLVVAPVSLLENWNREIRKFAPEIKVLVHHGSERTGRYKDFLAYDVVVTSYSAAVNDNSILRMIEWDLLVLDEAQNIKNPAANRTNAVKSIPHRASIAVTGTPFENHITDIWSLLDFSMPGCLGTRREFEAMYSDDLLGAEKIEPILSALMIRRRVADVAKDLPERIVIPQALVMNDYEALKYEEYRQQLLDEYDSKNITLATLTKLRMYCTHPSLTEDEVCYSDPAKSSSKYSRFCELVEEIISYGEKVIVFTSYSGMFAIMEKDIPLRFGIPVFSINGSTPVEERQPIVDQFSQHSGCVLMVLNPRAAGVGLNITAANHVIHYNLEWNPAIEDQATARAYRRGQDKTVFVHRLFFADTIEQSVNDAIEAKRQMSETAVVGTTGDLNSREFIMKALMNSPRNRRNEA